MGAARCMGWALASALFALGAVGCTGDRGPTGAAGEDGEQGPAGEPGDRGPKGADGADGAKGADGADGTAGAAGVDGADGPAGADGAPGPTSAEVFNALASPASSLSATIESVTIASPPVVQFAVTDAFGRGAVGLLAGSSGNIRFTLAKLVEGTDGDSDSWQSYLNRERGDPAVVQATQDRTGTLVDHGDGSYTYTFATDITAVASPVAVTYEPGLTHRLVLQISGGGQPAVNTVYDFVPDGSEVTATHNLVRTASCNECHGELRAHGSRYEVSFCVTCHNPGTLDSDTGLPLDLGVMTHKIHMGEHLPSVMSGGKYIAGGHDYSEVVFPQDLRNCRKCHDGDDPETPDGNNWKLVPTMEACGACHDDIDFAVGHVFDVGTGDYTVPPQTDNSNCFTCHAADVTERKHATDNVTVNNPLLPLNVVDVRYELLGATVNGSNQFVIDFNTYANDVRMDLNNLPVAGMPADGSTRSPSFVFYYALPQGGIAQPADFNNLGNPAGQPTSVALNVLTLVDQGTHFTATVDAASHGVPADATMRTVALQGYWEQKVTTSTTTRVLARHAASEAITVTGDSPRREIIDLDKCAGCHEIFEAHGGNRVFSVESSNVCVACHNPNLSSSGRTIDLGHPEATNNFRDMIHGIHSASVRSTPYEFVRSFRGSASVYDFSHVGFPGELNNCETCHLPGTYELPITPGLLPTTNVTTDGTNATVGDVSDARDSVPNDTDRVNSPTASACYMCHDDAGAVAHMSQNGGAIDWSRFDYTTGAPVETCAVCHDSDSLFSVSVVHGLSD